MKIKELQLKLLLSEVGLIDIEPCSELTLRFRDDNAVSLAKRNVHKHLNVTLFTF